jgi:DNA-binding NarL/FixJ family response regulator
MRPGNANPKVTRQLLSAPKGTALLVGEDPGELRYYCDILEQCGYRVRISNSYQEGVHLLADEVFQFVIVSQGTPKFEGSCVLKRAIEINRSVPVLVVARCVDMGCYLEAMQLGAVDYLVEPLTVSELGRVIENHLPVQMSSERSSSFAGDRNDFALSPLELQVIALVAAGSMRKESARRIGVSEHTFQQQLTNLLDKLRVANRLELVFFAAYHQLIGEV